jgi:hypothetical protein
MSALVVALAIAAVAWLASVAHKIVVALLVQEVRGALEDRLKRDIEDAVRPLPDDLRESYQAEWLGELDATKDRPLTAVLMVRGFKKATRGIIAADPALATVERGGSVFTRRMQNTMVKRLAPIGRAARSAHGPLSFEETVSWVLGSLVIAGVLITLAVAVLRHFPAGTTAGIGTLGLVTAGLVVRIIARRRRYRRH